MVNTLTISTLANAAIGLGYFYLASKLPGIDLNTRNQLGALCLSTIAQGIFIQRKEAHPQDISNIETISRYSFPYVLIGGASLCATNSTLKANAIAGILLGTAQVLVSEVSSRYMDNKINSSEFGMREWKEYLNVDVPAVEKPENIENILDARCPFWGDQGKKVRDTHMLVLIPATVNRRPFNLNVLRELMEDPKSIGHRGGILPPYDYIEEKFNSVVPESYWVLMTKKMVPNSIYKSYEEQENILRLAGYEPPSALEATTSLLTHFVRRGDCLGYEEKQHRQYLGHPGGKSEFYTSCKETTFKESTGLNSNLAIGNLVSDSKGRKKIIFFEHYFSEIMPKIQNTHYIDEVCPDYYINYTVGIAGLRKL